jgi:2-polyprenyl-6-methoxyphenol hydroxylase-like FAD-dependent oxidoreductase
MIPIESPDIVVVGGGIAGSSLALVLARQGMSVTVLERQPAYHDRVRGEFLHVWGVAEAQRLGLADILLNAGGVFATRMIVYDQMIPPRVAEAAARDVAGILPGVPGALCVGHPAACRALSHAAEAAGARVVRGIGAIHVTASARPTVAFELGGRAHELAPRLVVGADGRTSTVRDQAGITLHQAEPAHLISGLHVDSVPVWPQDIFAYGAEGDLVFLVAPQGRGRVRLYACTALDQRARYAGAGGPARLLADFRRLTCMPSGAALADGTPAGPCATFGGEDTWTDMPLAPGMVLIGDAAGYNNPIIGQGLALALRDVRMLSELVLDDGDWSLSRLMPYAEERRERLRRLRFIAALFAGLFATFGPEGAARRARFFSRLRDPNDLANVILLSMRAGPERAPAWAFTEAFRAELLGEAEEPVLARTTP